MRAWQPPCKKSEAGCAVGSLQAVLLLAVLAAQRRCHKVLQSSSCRHQLSCVPLHHGVDSYCRRTGSGVLRNTLDPAHLCASQSVAWIAAMGQFLQPLKRLLCCGALRYVQAHAILHQVHQLLRERQVPEDRSTVAHTTNLVRTMSVAGWCSDGTRTKTACSAAMHCEHRAWNRKGNAGPSPPVAPLLAPAACAAGP